MTTKNVSIIDSGISIKHAGSWAVPEAVREVVQNWLDVRKEYGCGGVLKYDGTKGIAVVKDLGPGIRVEHLAFGNNDKAEGSIGQFGEGLKSAFIVLVRNNRKVSLRANGMFIIPFVRMSANFGVDTLHYKLIPMEPRHAAKLHGTVVELECSEAEFETGKGYFTELVKKVTLDEHLESKEGMAWLEKNRISTPGGFVFVNGSKMGVIEKAMFSYHLTDEEAGSAINRDRNSMDSNVMSRIIARILADTSSRKVMACLFDDLFVKHIGSYESRLSLYVNHGHEKVWKRVWNEKFGKNYLRSSNPSNDANAEYRGYKVLSMSYDVDNFLESFGIESTSKYRKSAKAKARKDNRVKAHDLSKEELSNLKWSYKVTVRNYHDPEKVVVMNDLTGMGGSSESNPEGLFVRRNGKETIYIRKSVLSDREQTLRVLLHETVHKYSGASDITHEFEDALLNVAVGMLMKK